MKPPQQSTSWYGIALQDSGKEAADLVICLLHKAVTESPAALQQLAASPGALRFLVSPMVVSCRAQEGPLVCIRREVM